MFLQVSHFHHSFNTQHNKFITTGCDLISLQYLRFNVFNFIGLDFLYRVQNVLHAVSADKTFPPQNHYKFWQIYEQLRVWLFFSCCDPGLRCHCSLWYWPFSPAWWHTWHRFESYHIWTGSDTLWQSKCRIFSPHPGRITVGKQTFREHSDAFRASEKGAYPVVTHASSSAFVFLCCFL